MAVLALNPAQLMTTTVTIITCLDASTEANMNVYLAAQ